MLRYAALPALAAPLGGGGFRQAGGHDLIKPVLAGNRGELGCTRGVIWHVCDGQNLDSSQKGIVVQAITVRDAGQTVLIHGAAGGVGSIAVQLAHELGARVIGTGRAGDREAALGLGADAFVDLQADRLEDAGAVDVAFDVIGGEVLQRTAPLVRAGGTLVTTAGPPTVRPAGGRAIFFVVEPDRSRLADLARTRTADQPAGRPGRPARSRRARPRGGEPGSLARGSGFAPAAHDWSGLPGADVIRQSRRTVRTTWRRAGR